MCRFKKPLHLVLGLTVLALSSCKRNPEPSQSAAEAAAPPSNTAPGGESAKVADEAKKPVTSPREPWHDDDSLLTVPASPKAETAPAPGTPVLTPVPPAPWDEDVSAILQLQKKEQPEMTTVPSIPLRPEEALPTAPPPRPVSPTPDAEKLGNWRAPWDDPEPTLADLPAKTDYELRVEKLIETLKKEQATITRQAADLSTLRAKNLELAAKNDMLTGHLSKVTFDPRPVVITQVMLARDLANAKGGRLPEAMERKLARWEQKVEPTLRTAKDRVRSKKTDLLTALKGLDGTGSTADLLTFRDAADLVKELNAFVLELHTFAQP